VCVLDVAGEVLARKRISDSLDGVRTLHELLAPHAEEPEEVIVGIEKDRGLIVTAMLGAGYHVYALNPMSVARYRERHVTSGSKSDPGDAKVLADVVRTDRHNHREAVGNSEGAESLKALARSPVRNALKDYYPGALNAFGTDLDNGDAVEVLAIAPTPALGRQLSLATITSALRRGGRQRNLEHREENPELPARRAAQRAPEGRTRVRQDHQCSREHHPRLQHHDRRT
jgi:hypothetical protein